MRVYGSAATIVLDRAAAATPAGATSALAVAVADLPNVRAGSVVDAKYLRDRLQRFLGYLERADQVQAHLDALVQLAREKHIHLMLEQPGGGYFQTFEAFCVCAAPHGLGYRLDAIELLLAERQDLRVQARLARPLRGQGQHGASRPERRAVAGDAPPEARIKHGTGRRYWIAKLARDRPDLLARVESGEITSTQQAAVLAGWTSPLTWVRATAESFAAQAIKHLPVEEVPRLIAYLQAPATIPHPQGRTPHRRAVAA